MDTSNGSLCALCPNNWTLGKPAAFDFTVTSSLVSNSLPEASVTAGSAPFAAEERKHRSNDAKCAELGCHERPSHLQWRNMVAGGTEVKWALSCFPIGTRQNCP